MTNAVVVLLLSKLDEANVSVKGRGIWRPQEAQTKFPNSRRLQNKSRPLLAEFLPKFVGASLRRSNPNGEADEMRVSIECCECESRYKLERTVDGRQIRSQQYDAAINGKQSSHSLSFSQKCPGSRRRCSQRSHHFLRS